VKTARYIPRNSRVSQARASFQSRITVCGERSSACAHEMCVQGESRETPNGRTPAASNAALLSRRSSISFVQVDDQSKR